MTEIIENPDLIYSERGTPFKSEAFARNAITKKALDPNKFKVVPAPDGEEGFVLKRKEVQIKEEKYWWVTFNERQSEIEEKDVILAVNGDFLVMERNKRIIIPDRYKEAADHTTKPVFTMKPNEPRQDVGDIRLYNYACHGEATKEEYLKMKAEGNELSRKNN